MVGCLVMSGWTDVRRGVRPCGNAGGWMAHGQKSAQKLWEAVGCRDFGPSSRIALSVVGPATLGNLLVMASRASVLGVLKLVLDGHGRLEPVSELCPRGDFWSHLGDEPCRPRRLAVRFGLKTVVTWLILPVVICLSQRLSHACLSISKLYGETANGSLNQL